MKKIIYSSFSDEPNPNSSTIVYNVPDIDNRCNTLEDVLSWLDRLTEVKNNEENIRDH